MYSLETKKAVVKYYMEGHSSTQTAIKFHMSKATVLGWIKDYKKSGTIEISKTGPQSLYNDAQWEWIADRFVDGYSLKELSDFCGLSMTHLSRHVRKIRATRCSCVQPLSERKSEFNNL